MNLIVEQLSKRFAHQGQICCHESLTQLLYTSVPPDPPPLARNVTYEALTDPFADSCFVHSQLEPQLGRNTSDQQIRLSLVARPEPQRYFSFRSTAADRVEREK